jgi:hypothetical protein
MTRVVSIISRAGARWMNPAQFKKWEGPGHYCSISYKDEQGRLTSAQGPFEGVEVKGEAVLRVGGCDTLIKQNSIVWMQISIDDSAVTQGPKTKPKLPGRKDPIQSFENYKKAGGSLDRGEYNWIFEYSRTEDDISEALPLLMELGLGMPENLDLYMAARLVGALKNKDFSAQDLMIEAKLLRGRYADAQELRQIFNRG